MAASTIVDGIGQAVYQGTTNAATNALVGHQVNVTGFSLGTSNGDFYVIANTSSSITLSNAVAVSDSSGGSGQDQTETAVYTGVFTGGGSNALAGKTFVIANFLTNPSNNGTFICTASSATTITVDNANAIAETAAFSLTSVANASDGVAVYTGTVVATEGALAGLTFTVAGFGTTANNGSFAATANNGSTTITLANANAVVETGQTATASAATATNQEGSLSLT